MGLGVGEAWARLHGQSPVGQGPVACVATVGGAGEVALGSWPGSGAAGGGVARLGTLGARGSRHKGRACVATASARWGGEGVPGPRRISSLPCAYLSSLLPCRVAGAGRSAAWGRQPVSSWMGDWEARADGRAAAPGWWPEGGGESEIGERDAEL